MTLHRVMHFCALFWFGPPTSIFVTPKWPKRAKILTWLDGIILSPFHEVTLDNFGFLVGAHLTDQLAVIWVLIDQNCRFWAKNAFFFKVGNPIFGDILQKNYHFDGSRCRQCFWVDAVAQRAPGWAPEPNFLRQNWPFLRYTYITPLFGTQVDLTQWDYIFPIFWGNFGILWISGRTSGLLGM